MLSTAHSLVCEASPGSEYAAPTRQRTRFSKAPISRTTALVDTGRSHDGMSDRHPLQRQTETRQDETSRSANRHGHLLP